MKPAGERLAGFAPGPAAEPQPSPEGAAGPGGPRAAHPQPFPRRCRGSGAPGQPAPHKARRAMNKTSPGGGGEGIGIRERRQWKAKRGSGPAENGESSPRPLICGPGPGCSPRQPRSQRLPRAGAGGGRGQLRLPGGERRWRRGAERSGAERPHGERARRSGAGGAGAGPSPRGGAARPPGPRGVRGRRLRASTRGARGYRPCSSLPRTPGVPAALIATRTPVSQAMASERGGSR